MGDDGVSEQYLALVRDTPDEWRNTCESTSEGCMVLRNLSLIGVSPLIEADKYLGGVAEH